MAFRLRKDARLWFKDLQDSKDFTLEFDAFYFCLMAGLAMGRKEDIPTSDTAELTDTFPERYRERSRILVALFLATELKTLGVDMSNKKEVHNQVSQLIQPNSQNHLSDVGMKEFNRYAHGGYMVLREWFDDRPRVLHTFLRGFKERMDEVSSGQ